MTDVPAPLKAIVGLVATAMDRLPEPRQLPEKAVELPVLAVSAVLQASLRAQQVYAELTARGDEAISQLRGAPEEPPPWASFDDDVAAPTEGPGDPAPADAGLGDVRPPSAFDLADDAFPADDPATGTDTDTDTDTDTE